jgi:hypothetical protein
VIATLLSDLVDILVFLLQLNMQIAFFAFSSFLPSPSVVNSETT